MNVTTVNNRNFIALCVSVTNAKDDREREFLFKKALDEKIFDDEKNRDAAEFAGMSSKLITAVKKTAELLTEKYADMFWIVISERRYVPSAMPILFYEQDKGFIHFYKDEGKLALTIEKDENLIISLENNVLVKTFIEQLILYATKRNISINNVPLRLCEYCKSPFIGSRPDQRFCTTRHGTNWRARETYRRNKGKIK